MSRSFHRLVRALVSMTSLTAVLLAGSVMVATQASAHSKLSPGGSCPGGELSPHHDAFSGQISVFLFFSSANGGTNCAWAQKNVRRGTPEPLNIVLDRCSTGNPANPCNPTARDQDPGNWQFFAGPVILTNTSGRCIQITVIYRGQGVTFPPEHCG